MILQNVCFRTADTSALADADGVGTFSYQWQADGVDISDATSATLILTQAQVGKTITVKVTHTDATNNVEPAKTSVATAVVEASITIPLALLYLYRHKRHKLAR